MNLSITDEKLQIKFTFLEQFSAVRFKKTLEIPLSHIQQVTTTKPESNSIAIKVPGTHIPGFIKAGIYYYIDFSKEFWYVTRNKNYLVLELKDETYKRIVLTVEDNETWQRRLSGYQNF